MNHIKTRHFLLAITKPIYILKDIPKAISISNGRSLYPEKERKSKGKRIRENIAWLFKYGNYNYNYLYFGLDIVGTNPNDYEDTERFLRQRGDFNTLEGDFAQTGILRDKYLYFKYLTSNHIPNPNSFAVMFDGELLDTELNPLSEETLKTKVPFFLKDTGGQCGSFVKKITSFDQYLSVKDEIKEGKYIFQDVVVQSKEMDRLNPYSLNTIRVVTVYKNDGPVFLSSLIRVGGKDTGGIDNLSAGGFSVGINPDGSLKQYGLYSNEVLKKTEKHPDTGITLSEFSIPNYDKIIEAACNAHRYFYRVKSIGWDIAVTEDGAVFIEGNDNWGTALNQATDGPLKEKWKEAIKED